MYKLKEAIIYFRENSETIVQLGKSRWRILDSDEKFYNFLKNTTISPDTPEKEYLNFLLKENLLINVSQYPDDRFIKNRYYFENISKNTENIMQELFFKKRVLIVGLGGVGTVILFNLMAMGVKNFILIDGDNVELSNFNRQILFEISDIGKPKVEVLKDKLLEIDADIKVEILNEYLSSKGSVSKISNFQFDLLINAGDIPLNLNELLLKKIKSQNIDFITGTVGLYTGKFSSVIASKYIDDAIKYFDFTNRNIKSSILKASISPTNMIISSLISNEILKYWTNDEKPKSKMYFIDFITYNIESEDIKP